VRKFICFLLVCLFSVTGKVTANSDESFIIRKAYIDVIGIVPTTSEIEWYCVYNTNGYELAINWLVNHKDYGAHSHIIYTKEFLVSREYKASAKARITKNQVYKNLLYVTGSASLQITPQNVRNASLRLVQQALACNSGETEIIDYMCDAMMGRSSNLVEVNKLLKIFKNTGKKEIESWLDVLDEILELEDVNSK